MDPTQLVDWLTKLGPFAVAGVFAYVWKLEREERKLQQAAKDTANQKLLDVALDSAKAMAAQGEATRNELRALREAYERPRESK